MSKATHISGGLKMHRLELLGDRLYMTVFGAEGEQQLKGWELRWPFSSVALDRIKPQRAAQFLGTTHAHVSCQDARISF